MRMVSAIADTGQDEQAAQDNAQSDAMVLDDQTIFDLEIFGSMVDGAETLFRFCNHTRSYGGAEALRERMKKPWTTAPRIKAVQQSLSFILENRDIFSTLPSANTIQIVKNYYRITSLPIAAESFVNFGMGVIDLICTDGRRYDKLIQCVAVTISVLKTLQEISHAPELEQLQECELADMLEEMRFLLTRHGLPRVLEDEIRGYGAWKTLRTDQILRLSAHDDVMRLLQLIFEIEALVSMAETIRLNNFIMPEIIEGPLCMQAEELVHPMVSDAVSNPVRLDQQHRLLFLTGPNMAGKTTYMRACAVALYFAHLGMGVAARSFRFVPAQRIFTSITLTDNLHSGISFFLAEGKRMKAIAQALADGYRVIALMDEPFKGTNVKDAFDASKAILGRFAAKEECLFIFSSHLIELSEILQELPQVDCRFFEAREEGKLRFEYKLHAGISSQRLGMRVLQEQGIFELLDGEAFSDSEL